MNEKKRTYTVNLVFSPDLSQLLLVKKARTKFKGLLNGVGGELDPGEAPYACALREILEETGIGPDALAKLPQAAKQQPRLVWLGNLILPYDCKYGDDYKCSLHYYAGVLKAMPELKPGPDEPLCWVNTPDVNYGNMPEFAGDGDLIYFVRQALNALAGYDMKTEEPRHA